MNNWRRPLNSNNKGLRIAALFGLILCTAAYNWLSASVEKTQRASNTSVFSNQGSGLSAFETLTQKLKPGSLNIEQQFYSTKKSISSENVVALFSPLSPISNREAKIFENYVQGGGTLIVSFESKPEWAQVLIRLRKVFSLPEIVEARKSFQNGIATSVSTGHDMWIFKKDERYMIYSAFKFKDLNCTGKELSCYIHVEHNGKGMLVLMSGIPIFSNALIGRGDNSKAAFRLIDNSAKMTIDEYHHYYSSKTLKDLLTYLPFIVPILGMLLGLILFFAISYSDVYDVQESKPLKGGKSYHDVGERILMNFTKKAEFQKSAFERIYQFISHIFPDKNEDLSEIYKKASTNNKEMEHRILELLEYHKSLLMQKGKRG